ncbi:MAG: hypothetical protein HOY69_17715 [Streptomyces sp.]|nr:hypothetical protein [Streptomyces sp.]
MGVPDEDKLGTICKTDMGTIETSVSKIVTAIDAVNKLISCNTWVGTSADAWGNDFQSRMNSLKTLFGSYPPEEQRLIAKARQDQADMDRKRQIGH